MVVGCNFHYYPLIVKPYFEALNDDGYDIFSTRAKSTVISFILIAANPKLTPSDIHWYFMPQSSNEAIEITTSDNKYNFSFDMLTLTVNNTETTDIGEYKIVGLNTAGTGEAVITLKDVYGKLALYIVITEILIIVYSL